MIIIKKLSIILFLGLPLFAFADQDNGPLRVQMESKYVTDRSIWGQLIIQNNNGLSKEEKTIQKLIENYHRYWLDGRNNKLAELFDENILRFRGGLKTIGLNDTINRISDESRGERPSGYKSSMQMVIGDIHIEAERTFASSVFAVGVRGGARWEYSDLLTVVQLYRKIDQQWKIIGHFETSRLDNINIELPSDSVPDRRTPFTFDFVYPVIDLKRAIEFYSGLIGPPDIVTPTTASFKFRNSYFELNSNPPDKRITVDYGQTNGYGVIHVRSLDELIKKLSDKATIDAEIKLCGKGRCLVTSDESGNIIVWKEDYTINDAAFKKPSIHYTNKPSADDLFIKVVDQMKAWIGLDAATIAEMNLTNAIWIDDAYGLAYGKEDIASSIEARWENYDQGDYGVNADLVIKNYNEYPLNNKFIVNYEVEISARSNLKKNFDALVSQVWVKKENNYYVTSTFIAEAREIKKGQVTSMDYTAYPVNDLGQAGRFYKNLFQSEPYRDENWFGFWSTESVFGLVGPLGEVPWEPIPNKSNGYVDLTIRSADKVYAYLKQLGSSFPVIKAINYTPGIDEQPGYNQILSTDSEGNLINFSEYLEY